MQFLRLKINSETYQRLSEISNRIATELDQSLESDEEMRKEEERVAWQLRKFSSKRLQVSNTLVRRKSFFLSSSSLRKLSFSNWTKALAAASVLLLIYKFKDEERVPFQSKGSVQEHDCDFNFHQVFDKGKRQVVSHSYQGDRIPFYSNRLIFLSVNCQSKETVSIQIKTEKEWKVLRVLAQPSARILRSLEVKGKDVRELKILLRKQWLQIPFYLID